MSLTCWNALEKTQFVHITIDLLEVRWLSLGALLCIPVTIHFCRKVAPGQVDVHNHGQVQGKKRYCHASD